MFSPKNLILLLALLWASFALKAQSCFIQEDDATGSIAFSTEQLAELEAAACSLRAVFPTEFQSDFAVYDFGFYLHQQGYEGGMPQVFQDKIAEVEQESPYFLLFGRELSNNSGLDRIWVEVRLPEGSGYPCLEDAYSSGLIYNQVSASIEMEGGYSSVGVSNMLLSGIETLNTLVDKSVNCCNVSDGNRSPLCTFCWFEESKYAEILSDYGYIEYKNVSIVIDSLDDPYEGMVNSDYEITISTPAGHTVNLIDDTQGFLESTALTTLGFGQVDVYRYSAGNCELLDNFLRGEVVNFGQSGAVYEEKIIILDFEGELRVFYKFSLDSSYGPGGSSLRQDLNSGQRVVFLPVIAHWVLKKAALAGTGVLAHVGTTLVFERWFGEYDNWGDAWDNCTFTAWELIYAGWETAFAETAFIQFFGDIGNSMVSYIMSSSSGTFTWDDFLGIGVVGGVKDALINLFAAGAVEGILSKAKKIFQKYHPNLQPSSGGGNSGGGGNNDNNWFGLIKELVDLLPTFFDDIGTFKSWLKASQLVKSGDNAFKQLKKDPDFLRKFKGIINDADLNKHIFNGEAKYQDGLLRGFSGVHSNKNLVPPSQSSFNQGDIKIQITVNDYGNGYVKHKVQMYGKKGDGQGGWTDGWLKGKKRLSSQIVGLS